MTTNPVTVQGLFFKALDLDPSQRATFVEQACGSDHTLCQKVQRLLYYHEHAGAFMTEPFFDRKDEPEQDR